MREDIEERETDGEGDTSSVKRKIEKMNEETQKEIERERERFE